MNTLPLSAASAFPESTVIAAVPSAPLTSFSWAAIFAGLTTTLALQVLFVLLGAGLGFALYAPLTDDNPVADLGTGAIVVHGISAVLSLWCGGWMAGRFTPAGARHTGLWHGFSVWCAATVAGVLVVALGAGWATGDLAKIVGGGLAGAGKPVAAAAGGAVDMAKDALKQSGDTLGSFVDESVGGLPANSSPRVTMRAKREIGLAVARLFNPAQQGNVRENRATLIQTLTGDAGMSAPEAERMVDAWTASYDRLKADLAMVKTEAATKAREAADKSARALTFFSLGTFVAFCIGAVAASCGGRSGANHATRAEQQVDLRA